MLSDVDWFKDIVEPRDDVLACRVASVVRVCVA